MLDQKVADLATKMFKEYYSKADDFFPTELEKREFGFGDYEKKIAYRHLAFKTNAEFKKYVVDKGPPFISYSNAHYERPDGRPMEAKGWLGSELIFDLDASDLHLPCQKQHDRSWVCENCLDSVKKETIRLVEDFLVPDFGFSEKEIKVNFSGNRGYHVHVINRDIFKLDSKARRQISEYITGAGIDAGRLFELRSVERDDGRKIKVLYGPRPTDGGWGGKVARGMISALNTGVATLEETGVDKTLAKRLFKNRADIVLGISTGNWDKVMIPNKTEFWAGVLRKMAITQSDSIDRNVTNDTGHLIRLPNTLHGDTGLLGLDIGSVKGLDRFDPMRDAVVFKGKSMKVHINRAEKFMMNGEHFGPWDNATVELPLYVALYLLLKRVAVLA